MTDEPRKLGWRKGEKWTVWDAVSRAGICGTYEDKASAQKHVDEMGGGPWAWVQERTIE